MHILRHTEIGLVERILGPYPILCLRYFLTAQRSSRNLVVGWLVCLSNAFFEKVTFPIEQELHLILYNNSRASSNSGDSSESSDRSDIIDRSDSSHSGVFFEIQGKCSNQFL